MDTPAITNRPLILNVEDRDGPRYVKSRILNRAKFSVLEATTGQAALSLVRQHSPALVLLGVKLPDMSGLEVCRLLKRDPATARTLILLTSTGLADARQRVQVLDCGADSHLVEPAEPEEMLLSINALLRQREAEDALRHTTQTLRESEGMFRQLAESLADVVWILDPDEKRLLFVSPSVAALLGHTAEEVLDNPGRCLDRVPPADRPRVEAAFADMLRNGRMEIEFQLTRPGGEIREIHARAFPIRSRPGADGRSLPVAGICQDVTTQNRALRALRDEQRRKDQFLAMLAHELRNPLAPMRSAADLLQQLSPSREDMFRARDVIGRQLHHLTRLVDELLNISRFNQGKITLRQDLVELRSALNTAVETVRPLLDANGQILRLALPEQALPVRGDLVRLTQIFSNLLQNAATYTPAAGQISVDATTQEGQVTVRVRDNGAGLSEAMQRRLFDPLAPDDTIGGETGADAQRGSALQDGPGIGLTLVQKLVRLHGGRIHVESPGPGEGSTFIVVLPVEPWQCWHPPRGMTVPHSGPRRTVMLVDDNIDALEAMTMTLQALGHTVVTASDGQSAVARAASVRPDVILLDLGMPAMDGFETARRLRALPELSGAKLVALTGFGQPEDKRRTLEAGFDLHLVKPADLDELTRLLDGLDA
ncbi:signal transduction histidine kinase [Cupriavidus basilensis OR16]|uniref:histidine kinase n=1 Tax=Cupriavidus basilensis OR16 TaxID=1127483 RepID=H1RZQ4_9BURK|nr:response regulator [Cupriavidus basilensis]EHP44120.1 signal transduction histidine kinase [Cupriavidus basilensis OR16]